MISGIPFIMESLPDIDKNRAFVFTVTSDSTLNKTDMKGYTKGIYIPSNRDAVIIGLSYTNNVYFRYRNNGKWQALKIL